MKKKIAKFIRRLITAIVVISIIVFSFGIAYTILDPSWVAGDPEIEREVIATTTPVVVEEKDTIVEAQELLMEGKKKLDAEEARLLEEIAEREARIEEISTIRASF